MAHSVGRLCGEKVDNFVMSVIEAVGNASGGGGIRGGPNIVGGGRNGNKSSSVSPYPVPPSLSSPSTTGKSQKSSSSQELVEDALGSLATLLSVSSSTVFFQGTDGVIKVVGRNKSGGGGSGGKVHTKRKDVNNPPRKNILRRKKSSLKALSPEDLGRVSKSPLQLDALSPLPPSLLVTFPSTSSSSGSSPSNERHFNDKGEKITAAESLKNVEDEHPSTFHLRKPISSYVNNNSKNYNKNNSNGKRINNSNKDKQQENEIKIDSVNNGIASGASSSGGARGTFKDITKNMLGQRSSNYTSSSKGGSPEPLHNNGNNNNSNCRHGSSCSTSDGVGVVAGSPKQDDSPQKYLADDVTCSATNLQQRETKAADEKDDNGKELRRLQQKLDSLVVGEDGDDDDGCHGRQMCVHHYHHHSHHHHYHYYEKSSSSGGGGQKNSFRGHHHPQHYNNHHCTFTTNNNNQRVDDQQNHDDSQQQNDNVEESNNINSDIGLNPRQQQQQQSHLHNHHSTNLIKNDADSSACPPAQQQQSPKPPPPRHENPPVDISFYRKFSATSPPPNYASRYGRSKSSLEWAAAAAETELSVFISSTSIGGGKLCSKTKRHKSRSTPVRLDGIGSAKKVTPAEPVVSPTDHNDSELYPYGCKCGGCHFCCNELSCNCCCDECCCARQCNILSTLEVDNEGEISKNGTLEKTGEHDDDDEGRTVSPVGKKAFYFQKGRSHSMDSILSLYNNNDNNLADTDDEVLNDPDSFIDNHLLRHLELFDTDNDDEEVEGEETRHDSSTKNSSDEADDQEKEYAGGQLQLISIDREEISATGHVHPLDTNGDDDHDGNNTTRLVVVGNVRDGSVTSRTTTAELISPRRSTSIVIVRKTPTRSSIHRSISGGDTGGVVAGTSRRRRSTNSSSNGTLRTANGEIRSSPITPGNSNVGGGASVVVEEQARRNATMTVTVDSMSLFLDAVHLQMNQG